jgi:hypothetical protein
MSTKLHAKSVLSRNSRQAVEEAIGAAKADRESKWDELVSGVSRRAGPWDGASCGAQVAPQAADTTGCDDSSNPPESPAPIKPPE